MERFNEVRDREKVMRGLKKVDTPILAGYQIYHNYMRPHEGLDISQPIKTLLFGDNLRILRESIPSNFVDLVYLDPPFNSQADYNILFKKSSGALY